MLILKIASIGDKKKLRIKRKNYLISILKERQKIAASLHADLA